MFTLFGNFSRFRCRPRGHCSTAGPVVRALAAATVLTSLTGWCAAEAFDLPVANLVIGGAERRCSSFAGFAQSAHCSADWATILARDPTFAGMTREDISFEADYPSVVATYDITPATLEAVRRIPTALWDAQRKLAAVRQLQRALTLQPEQRGLGWDAVQAALTGTALTHAEQALLRSALVRREPQAPRRIQARSTPFTADADSAAIAYAVVAAARRLNGGNKPLIGVVTASASPHAFVDRDINMLALQSAGADVVYIPLERGLRHALDANDCDNLPYYYDYYANRSSTRPVVHADRAFPDLAALQKTFCADRGRLLNETLEQVHALYFSGGNQARHLESWVTPAAQGQHARPSAQLTIVQRRHAQGRMLVAGTSAGNHIQGGGLWRGRPVPMIGGGDAYPVLRDGFALASEPASDAPPADAADTPTAYPPLLYPDGGLGVFRFGVLDSHFSRRAREARLIRAAFDSGMDYGFGVDENTALRVSQPDAQGTTHFGVVGAGGVFIADLRAAHGTPGASQPLHIEGVRAHYLLPGDRAQIDTSGHLQVRLAAPSGMVPPAPAATLVQQHAVLDYGASGFVQLATAMGLQGAHAAYGTTARSVDRRSAQTSPLYSVTLRRDDQTAFAMRPQRGRSGALSYRGVLVAFAPCQATCQPPQGFEPIVARLPPHGPSP